MIALAIIGLLIITLSWAMQLFFIQKGEKQFHPFFMIGYALGAAVLALDGFLEKSWILAPLNLICAGLVLIIINKLKVRQ